MISSYLDGLNNFWPNFLLELLDFLPWFNSSWVNDLVWLRRTTVRQKWMTTFDKKKIFFAVLYDSICCKRLGTRYLVPQHQIRPQINNYWLINYLSLKNNVHTLWWLNLLHTSRQLRTLCCYLFHWHLCLDWKKNTRSLQVACRTGGLAGQRKTRYCSAVYATDSAVCKSLFNAKSYCVGSLRLQKMFRDHAYIQQLSVILTINWG